LCDIEKESYLSSWDKIYIECDLDVAAKDMSDSRPLFFDDQYATAGSDELFSVSGQSRNTYVPKVLEEIKADHHVEFSDVEIQEYVSPAVLLKCPCESNEHRTMIYDILNNIYQSEFGPSLDGYTTMMTLGNCDSNIQWHNIEQKAIVNATETLESINIAEIEMSVKQVMQDSRLSIIESKNRVEELQRSIDELNRINTLLEDAALDASQRAELERLKQIEEERKKSLIELCGVCFRLNNRTSGCGYGGNSPIPIRITIDDYERRYK
jgi:hypothetical protein